MKEEFPGYFMPTKDEIDSIWNNATFVFDANVILNLYRYSDSTKNEVFKKLELVTDRTWFPNQVIFEYLENRLQVIFEQAKTYDSIITELKNTESKFDNTRKHPFLSDKVLRNLKNVYKEVDKELKLSKESYVKRVGNDEILDKMLNLT